MSVKATAQKLGVGRPALSNLLNGKASLSPEMAARLERAFGADRKNLLDHQEDFDKVRRREDEKDLAVRTYVPGFLTIKARQIHDWAEELKSRQLLAVLLRKLIHSTGHELRRVYFPGFDDAERKGWDGTIDAGAATPWIPAGNSGWEFGTSKSPSVKARKDYENRLASTTPAEQADLSFVFVTPRIWPGKNEWEKKRNADGHWKEVRAFDASDLEQWLEVSIPAQIWLAERLNLPRKGFETLDNCWKRWSEASSPPMTREVFEPSIVAHLTQFESWLQKKSERPLIVAADSKDEGLAFLSCLFERSSTDEKRRDLATAFESAETLKLLSSSSSPFIPIACNDDVEKELASVYHRFHCIVVRPRNAVDSDPDIALEPLSDEAFEKAVTAMGVQKDAERLGRESGRSPTILRRRLSKIEAIRTPQWAKDSSIARTLVPMALVGAWHTKSNADREVVAALADRTYDNIEKSITDLLQLDDCPIWSVGQYRGVASKLDALFATRRYITEKDLEEFFWLSEHVLSESDPALDLPDDKRWAAGIYGKVRDHSSALREGVRETLVILAIHGNTLFQDRLGINVEHRVSDLIRRLLTPLTHEKLFSHEQDLPRYAEAAPEEFLGILEEDLKKRKPVVLSLLKRGGDGLFGGCPRTGLLWALECLAWNPRNLLRVTGVLAHLSRTKIEDNWANKPIASLEAIFRSWMPQTAASVEARTKALETLMDRFPDIGWRICVDQLRSGPRFGHYSYQPRWRSDAAGAGRPVGGKENYDFTRKALDLTLSWPGHNAETLGDLVERLTGLPEKDQSAVWGLITTWSGKTTDWRAKAILRERIRRFAFTRRGQRLALGDKTRDRAREIYALLEPKDPVIRNAWLFANHWVEESHDEVAEEDFDYKKRDERIHTLRIAALREVLSDSGNEGIVRLLSDKASPQTLGFYTSKCLAKVQARSDCLSHFLTLKPSLKEEADGFIRGFLHSLEAKVREEILATVTTTVSDDALLRILQLAPFRGETWRRLDKHDQEIRDRYWKNVIPQLERHSDAEVNELIDRLLEVNRPRAAFLAVHFNWSQVETSRLKRLLQAVATGNAEPTEEYRLNDYDISSALDSLDGRTGVSRDEMAQLEFLYFSILEHSRHGFPNLEHQIAESPALFIQILTLATKRTDGGQDPPEYRIEDPDRRAAVSSKAYHLLGQIRFRSGKDSEEKVTDKSILSWVKEVRRLSTQCGRAKTGDHFLGQVLSKSPPADDGTWPCDPVCEAMEAIASKDMADGFYIGVRNGRGVHFRGEGGGQERELASKYRNWSEQLALNYPFVSSILKTIEAAYEHEGKWEDSRAKIRKRLRH